MLVVDASVAMKWFLAEPHKDKADKILQDFGDESLELIAPDLLVAEVGNALWKRCALRHEITAAEAGDSFRDFLALNIKLHPSSGLAPAALKLALSERRPLYDMVYITLAEQDACELVTGDEKLFRALGKKFGCLRWIGDF